MKIFCEKSLYLNPGNYLKRCVKKETEQSLFVEGEYQSGQAYWALDNHRLLDSVDFQERIVGAKAVFYTQPALTQQILNKRINKEIPTICLCMFAVDTTIYKKVDIEKKYDIGFIGDLGQRKEFIEEIKEHFKDRMFIGVAENTEKTVAEINKCRIVINKSRFGEINMRVFESMACGVLLTDRVSGIETVGDEGVHYVSYINKKDLIEKAEMLLSCPEKMSWIQKKARKNVLQKHTYWHRLNTIANFLKFL